MNKKTKAFLWVIGAVLVLLGAAMVLYSVGLTSGWFGGETAEPPQASSSTPAPEDDQKPVSYTHLDVYKRQLQGKGYPADDRRGADRRRQDRVPLLL